MTGQYEAFGEQIRHGVEVAVDDLNAAGGVLGRKIVVSVEDDQCDARRAVAVANEVAAKGASLVVGHFCSGASVAASAVYAEEGILQITPASASPALTDEAAAKGWTNVFRTCGRDDAQGVVAGRYLAQRYKGRNVAIIHDETAYGIGLAARVQSVMNAAGVKEVLFESYPSGASDHVALLSKLRAARLDALYVAAERYGEAATLIRRVREQGVRAQIVSGDALLTQEFPTISGVAGEGILVTSLADPRGSEVAEPVVGRFAARKLSADGYVLYAYAAIQVWASAAGASSTIESAKVAQHLRRHKFPTALGELSFDEKGDVSDPQYQWYVLRNGSYVPTPAKQ